MPIEPHAPVPDDDMVSCCACPLPVSNTRVHSVLPANWVDVGYTTDPEVPDSMRRYTPAAVALDAPVTSADAAAAVEPRRGHLRAAILALLAQRPEGLTDDQLEQLLEQPHQTVSSARNALMRDLAITKHADGDGNTITRKTRSGRHAIVWVIRKAAA